MKRALILACAVFTFAPQAEARLAPAIAAGQASATATAGALAGAERAAAIASANRALNAITALSGRFSQLSPDGSRSAGAFHLQRPGRLRFEYDAPATLLVVANAGTLFMRDRELRTTERTTVESTPLNLILKQNIDLARDARIIRVARQGGALLITARDRSGATDGEITLRLEGPDLELRSWDVVDATGARTRVWLSDVSAPATLDRRLFRLDDVLDPARRGPR